MMMRICGTVFSGFKRTCRRNDGFAINVLFVLRYKRDPHGNPVLVPLHGYLGRVSESAASADRHPAQSGSPARRLIASQPNRLTKHSGSPGRPLRQRHQYPWHLPLNGE
jgi:hypothetical protein